MRGPKPCTPATPTRRSPTTPTTCATSTSRRRCSMAGARPFATISGPVGSELRDLKIETGGDVAFAHCFNRIHGKRTDGSETNVWIRLTLCFRKIGGAWKVTHEQTSVQLYMDGSFKAAVDL